MGAYKQWVGGSSPKTLPPSRNVNRATLRPWQFCSALSSVPTKDGKAVNNPVLVTSSEPGSQGSMGLRTLAQNTK